MQAKKFFYWPLNSQPFFKYMQILWRCVTICNIILEFVKILFTTVMQSCKPIRATLASRCWFESLNMREPQKKLCDRRHCAWPWIWDLKRSGKPAWMVGFAKLKNTSSENCALLITRLRIRGSLAGSLPSNRRTFYSGINLILMCEVIKTESSDWW